MKRRYVVLIAVLVLLAVLAAVLSKILFPAGERALEVLSVRGDVRVESKSGPTVLTAGARVLPGQSVTTGHEGEAVLSGLGNSTITVAEHSKIFLEGVSGDGVSRFRLDEGRVRSVVPEGKGGGVEIRGGREGATARTRGGDIAVGIDGAGDLSVATFKGKATLDVGGNSKDVNAGEQAIARAGKVEVGAIPTEVLLKVAWPETGKTNERTKNVEVVAPPGSMVRVDDRRVTLDSSGHGIVAVNLVEGENRIHLQAEDIAGNHKDETSGVIVLDTKPPDIHGGHTQWK